MRRYFFANYIFSDCILNFRKSQEVTDPYDFFLIFKVQLCHVGGRCVPPPVLGTLKKPSPGRVNVVSYNWPYLCSILENPKQNPNNVTKNS